MRTLLVLTSLSMFCVAAMAPAQAMTDRAGLKALVAPPVTKAGYICGPGRHWSAVLKRCVWNG